MKINTTLTVGTPSPDPIEKPPGDFFFPDPALFMLPPAILDDDLRFLFRAGVRPVSDGGAAPAKNTNGRNIIKHHFEFTGYLSYE